MSLASHSKWQLIIFGVVVCILIVPIIALAVLYARERNNAKPAENDDLCLTPYCIKAANYLIDSIDESVEPCEDFYQFSCGTWLTKNRIPDDANIQGSFQILQNELNDNIVELLSTITDKDALPFKYISNARNLYRACVDENSIDSDGVEPVISLIKSEFGGWPILQDSSWNESKFDLQNLLTKLRNYDSDYIFRIISEVDERNSSATIIFVAQGSLGLPQRQYYANESNLTTAYRTYMSKFAESLTNNASMISQDVKEMFEFEKNISKFYWTNAEQNARHNETVYTNVFNLSRFLDTSINFTKYLLESYHQGNITLNDMDPVTLSELEFLTNASSIISRTSKRTLQNYFVWRFLMDRAENMPRNIRNIRSQFMRVFQGTNAEKPRAVQCGNYVNDQMGFVVSKLYIKKYFDESARNQALDMIKAIQNSFIDLIENSVWMEKQSKEKAIEKAKSIDEQIGYPQYINSDNDTKLQSDYADYVFNTSHIINVLKLLQIKSRENFQFLRKPVDRKAWGVLPPTVVNAFYNPSQNRILFPAGILQTPFFNKDAPKYLNFGGIGMVIGHEITHGFDDTGRQFDKDGNRIPWWTPDTIGKFNNLKECIVNQYSNYSVPQINMNSNGEQTQGENIADNGGIKAAFYAYRDWSKSNINIDKRLPGLSKYSPEQLFFINFANIWCAKMTDEYARNRILTGVHSLGQFRVVGPSSNFIEFDRAFGCKPGQNNSRVTKCGVW